MLTAFSAPLPVTFTVTTPPPEAPSTSSVVEFGLGVLQLLLHGLRLLHQAHDIAHLHSPPSGGADAGS